MMRALALLIAFTASAYARPAGQVILDAVQAAIAAVPGVTRAEVRLVWEPEWTPERVTPRGREHLGWR